MSLLNQKMTESSVILTSRFFPLVVSSKLANRGHCVAPSYNTHLCHRSIKVMFQSIGGTVGHHHESCGTEVGLGGEVTQHNLSKQNVPRGQQPVSAVSPLKANQLMNINSVFSRYIISLHLLEKTRSHVLPCTILL